jgi:hypothetical protein
MASVGLVKTATKLAIGVGAVYVTLDQGVWSGSNQGSKALDNMKTRVLPAANEYLQRVPSAGDFNNKVCNAWNWGVQKTFGGLAAAPDTVGEYGKKAVDQVKQSLKP